MSTEYIMSMPSFSVWGLLLLGIPIIIIYVFYAIVFYKLFLKAHRPAWYGFVPIVNIWQLVKIVWGKGWPSILLFVPILNIIIWAIVSFKYAESFDFGTGFTLFMILFSPIAIPILAFGSFDYYGVSGEEDEDYEYYNEFNDNRSAISIFLSKRIRNTASFIKSVIISVIVLALLIGFLYFGTDLELKFDPTKKEQPKIKEEIIEKDYNDNW